MDIITFLQPLVVFICPLFDRYRGNNSEIYFYVCLLHSLSLKVTVSLENSRTGMSC
jgi:hypothetical protein